ncbi:MAG: hypothetical protein ACYDD1_08265 [Caulobacteraceae bacterium]
MKATFGVDQWALATGAFEVHVVGWRPDTAARPPIDLEAGLVNPATIEVAPTARAAKWRLTLDLPTGAFSVDVDARRQGGVARRR